MNYNCPPSEQNNIFTTEQQNNVQVIQSIPASNFKVVTFTGLTDGTDLVADSNLLGIQNRVVTFKRIKASFYAPAGTPIVNAFQSTTYPAYTAGTFLITPAGGLLLNEFVTAYGTGPILNLFINNSPLIFLNQTLGTDAYIDYDNLFIKYPSAVSNQGIKARCTMTVPDDYTAGSPNLVNVNIKLVLELILDYDG